MKKSLKILSITVMFILILSLISIVNAATGSFSVSPTSKTLEKGKTVTITITAKNCGGEFTVSSSDTSVATVSKSSVWVESGSATVTVTAKKEGKATISVKANDVADTNVDPNIITGTKNVSITVKDSTTNNNNKNTTNTTTTKDTTTEKKKEKSNNAYLSTLGVTPKEYDFSGFSKNKTSYNVTVPSDVDSLKVMYKTADPNAKVKITGNSGFEVGSNNKITVKVTAEDGKTTKTYTIKVTKLAEDAEKPGNLIEDNEGLYLTSLELEGVTLSPEFAKDIYSYTATLSSSDITEVNVKATANNDKAKIDISGNTELTEGENTINVIVRLEDSSVQTVYQVVVTKEAATTNVETTSAEENNLNTTDLVGTIKNYIKIIIAVVIGIILLIIILTLLLKKENKRLKGEDIDQEDDNGEEEYNVYKNDLDEFEDKNSQGENLIETLYKQKNEELYEEENLTQEDKETLEEINKQTEEIFREKVKGQSVEYNNTELYTEDFLEERRKRRGKGKHSK